MTTPCHNCPINSEDFRTTVVESLAVLTRQMSILVGPDGTNGELSKLKAKVEGHDEYINRQKGAGGVLKNIWTTLLAFAGTMVALWVKGHAK